MSAIYRTDYMEIRRIMMERRIDSIQDLAAKTGVNRNTLGKILSGKARPSSEVMERLVYTLNIQPEKAGKIFFGTVLPHLGR